MDTNGKQPEAAGVLGNGALHAGKGNMALARRAFREGWPIKPEVKQAVVDQMAKIVEYSPDQRNQIAAAKVLVAADSVNARREATESQEDRPPGAVNVQVNVGVREDEHWYGNNSHALAAQTTASPGPGTPVPIPVQSDSLRPPVGENGHGASNGHAGPRGE